MTDYLPQRMDEMMRAFDVPSGMYNFTGAVTDDVRARYAE